MDRRALVNVKLDRDAATQLVELPSLILNSVSSYKDDELLAFLEDSSASSGKGQMFSYIEPRSDSTFEVELGLPLPHWLPNINGQQEFVIEVKRPCGAHRTLCVSNQMLKLLYVTGGQQYHAILPRRLREWVEAEGKIPKNAPIAPLRTIVTSSFSLPGPTAEAALCSIDDCINELIECLNEVAVATVAVNERVFPGFVSPAYHKSTVEAAYFIMRGKEPDKYANWRMATSLSQAVLRPPANLSEEEGHFARQILLGDGELDDVARLIQVGRAYTEIGLLEFAFLQLVIAAEMATGRYVHQALIASGVSRAKVRDSKTDLTFAMMLNVHVVALAPACSKPDPQLIGKINEARKRRNKLMHEGSFETTREYIRELGEAVRTYVAFLDDIFPTIADT